MKLIRILYPDPHPPTTKYRVTLAPTERRELQQLLAAGTAPARTRTHARILLKADAAPGGPGWSDAHSRDALDASPSTILRVQRAYCTRGLEAALHRKAPDRVYRRKLDGRREARLVELACSSVPVGQARWTLLSDGGLPHRSAEQRLPSAPARCATCNVGGTNSGARRTCRARAPGDGGRCTLRCARCFIGGDDHA